MTPQFYSFRETPADAMAVQAAFRDMADKQHEHGATWWRFTIVSPEYPIPPCPPYPPGLYVEGWEERPSEAPAFDFPLTRATEEAPAAQPTEKEGSNG